jgi:hypothetical protein
MIGERWAGVPVAWAAVAENGQPLWLAYDRPADATAVPLYRHSQPTLTDAEREAVEYVCRNVLPDGSREGDDALHLLRMLLKRTQ